MSKAVIVWLIMAAVLVVVGLVIFGVAMTANKWDFNALDSKKYETNEYVIEDAFDSISVNTDTADLTLLPSADGKCRVVCYEESKMKHSVSVIDETLTVNVVNEKKWYDYIGIYMEKQTLTVYLPEERYNALTVKGSTGDVEIPADFRFQTVDIQSSTGHVKLLSTVFDLIKVKVSTGDVRIQSLACGALDISSSTGDVLVTDVGCSGEVKIKVSTGDVYLTNVTCKTLLSTGSTGVITLKNVLAAESFSIERNTGDVRFDGSDAAKITVKTDTGDVRGMLLSEKLFVTKSDTGKILVPTSRGENRCEISTDTGDIIVSVQQ